MARSRALAFVVAAVGASTLGATCDAFLPLESANILGRLAEPKVLVGAYEVKDPTCDLQASPDDRLPSRDDGWRAVAKNELHGHELVVEERRPFALRDRSQDSVYAALRVADRKTNKRFWIRSTPAPDAASAQRRFACLVAEDEAKAAAPKLAAARVALAPRAPECTDVAPVFGGRWDLSFEPYDVGQRTLVTTASGKPYVAVRLVQKEPVARTLTVPGTVLDRCFVAADPEAPRLDADAARLADWLAGPTPEAAAPPPLDQGVVERLTGVDARTCPKLGPEAAPTYACRIPVVRFASVPEPGPFGPARVRLLRERRVDALYFRGGKLVGGAEAPATNVAVRARAGGTPGFARALDAELRRVDPERTRRRLLAGARLLRPQDATRAATAAYTFEIEVAYAAPPVEPATEVWTHRYSAGKKDVANPARALADAALFDAKAAAESFDREVVLAERVGGDAAYVADAIAARTAAQRRAQEAEATAHATAPSLEVDDERTWDFSTKVLRRRGDAVYHVTLATEGRTKTVELDTSGTLTFDVMDAELPADAAHKLTARAARAPATDEVDRKVAALVVERLEELLAKWDAQKGARGDVGDMAPGSRSWMVGVARQATNGRPVRLLGDLVERRSDVLAFDAVTYAVVLGEEARRGCLAFAASAGGRSGIDLSFGKRSGASVLPIAADTRAAADAAIEVCALPAGDYALTVAWTKLGEVRRPVVVSMFDTSPGRVTAEDTAGAARGLPYLARAGETLRFLGPSLARVLGDGGAEPIGPTGDRDGDGIPDDADQCPELAETRNGVRDEDGCPDDPTDGG